MINTIAAVFGKVPEGFKYSHWYEWERAFLYFPKTDINGKLIIGRAWKKERYGSITGEYNPKTGMTPIHQCTQAAYANDKDVFVEKLKDKPNDT